MTDGPAIVSQEDYAAHLASALVARRFRFEQYLARRYRDRPTFHLDAICEVCDEPVSLLVDRQSGARGSDGIWLPNWRERLVCPRCQLNCRQRAILASTLRAIAGGEAGETSRVYAMEQITPLFASLAARAGDAECVGSEYLGDHRTRGEVVDGVRHEDAEQLTFESRSFDVVLSNDVLEHVPSPRRALAEAVRVLRPGGAMLFTIPFDTSRETSRARAERRGDDVVHLLPAEYHGDPLTGRSLVFTDFGWDFLAWCREAGFRRCAAEPYWSLEHGYLGAGHLLFRAET